MIFTFDRIAHENHWQITPYHPVSDKKIFNPQRAINYFIFYILLLSLKHMQNYENSQISITSPLSFYVLVDCIIVMSHRQVLQHIFFLVFNRLSSEGL